MYTSELVSWPKEPFTETKREINASSPKQAFSTNSYESKLIQFFFQWKPGLKFKKIARKSSTKATQALST